MTKENGSFLNKVNANVEKFNQEALRQKEDKLRQEEKERLSREEILSREQKRIQEQIEISKKEFQRIGVVDAFNELIESKTIYIYSGNSYKYEPVYGIFGNKKGEKRVNFHKYEPAVIEYTQNEIKLITQKYESSNDGFSTDYYGSHIGVIKKENNIYEVGIFYAHEQNKHLSSKIVPEDQVLDTLVEIVSDYIRNRR